MDPSMLKFLEDDEDDADVDTVYVDGADVDAYTASLNRAIQETSIMRGTNQQPLPVGINDEQAMTLEMSNQPVFRTELSNQPAMHTGGANQQAMNLSNRGKKVPFSLLLPVIQSLLVRDKSRSMQLQILWQTFQNNEITKEAFIREMRTIVGDQMIKMAGYKIKRKPTRNAAAQQDVQEPSIVPAESSDFTLDYNALQQYEADSHNTQATQMPSYFSASSQGLSSVPTVHAERENTNPGNLKNDASEMQSSKVGFLASTSQMDYNLPLNSQVPSAPSPIKKTPVGQKKPLEALGSSPSPSSKKRKVSSGAFLDQSIEQLNDVTAVSGVNLREEEEQLLSVPKEDGKVSETSRRVMQEEEDRLVLQKIPLQKKLAHIMTKSGLKSIGNDVEKCLSLCFEERFRGLMNSLIKLSRQRVDIERPGHRTFITTDVQEKIRAINQEVRVEWEKKQTEEEKLERLIEPEGRTAFDGDKEKDESRARPVKVVANKEVDEKMRTTAANVAARAAVGGDDILSKWQLLAEKARQKIEGGTDGSSSLQAAEDVSRTTSTAVKSERDHHEAEKRGQSSSTPGSTRKLGRNQVIMAHNRVACTISVRDLIAVLEREAQMSRSTLMYRLYDEIHTE